MKKIDFHIHLSNNNIIPIEQSVENLTRYCKSKNLCGVCILGLYVSSSGENRYCNDRALAISKAMPDSYAFAGLLPDRDYVEQAKEYMEKGFKGIKLIEGKPSMYRRYGSGYEHPRFEAFFDYAEKNEIPLIIHNNDPARNWNKSLMSPSSIKKGWYYDESMPSHDYFTKVMEDVFDRHPMLHAALAHFGFYSNKIDGAVRLMEKCPNLMMDMTPAPIIYEQFSDTPEQTRDFILKYQDRMFYGTDVINIIEGSVKELNDRKTAIMDAFYEGKGEYTVGKYRIVGMNLDESILKKIYYDNAMNFIK